MFLVKYSVFQQMIEEVNSSVRYSKFSLVTSKCCIWITYHFFFKERNRFTSVFTVVLQNSTHCLTFKAPTAQPISEFATIHNTFTILKHFVFIKRQIYIQKFYTTAFCRSVYQSLKIYLQLMRTTHYQATQNGGNSVTFKL